MPMMPAVLGPNTRLNNVRLGYLPAAVAADRPYHVRILVGGIDLTGPGAHARVLYKSLTIRDLLFDAPNTCAFTCYGAAPTIGQRIEVWFNSNTPVLLFSGEIQTVERTYKGRPTTVLYPCTAIDDTAAANRKRPLQPFVNVSASTVAQTLIATYCPGFSSAGVAPNLPVVTVNFDGSEGGLKGCLTQVAKLIGGYWFFENKTLYLFQDPPGTPPDPIDATPGRLLHDPAITRAIDKSQVRTRVYGKGASARILADIAATTTVVPIETASMFNPLGGKAIAGQTPDGAASRVLTYTGIQAGGQGGLVGPGAAPSVALGLALLDGAGVESGLHRYAYTFTTAAGESLAGPAAAITVGPVAPPVTAPVPGAVQAGGAIDPGTYYYGVSFVTSVGETTPSAAGPPVTTAFGGHDVPPPTARMAAKNVEFAGTLDYPAGSVMTFRYAFVNAAGVTTAAPLSNAVTAVIDPFYGAPYVKGIQLTHAVSADPSVTGKRIYQYRNGTFQGSYLITPDSTMHVDGQETLEAVPPSGTNTAQVPGTDYQTVPLAGIVTGPANVTARRLYRWRSDFATWRLVATIANNTATTYTDTIANASLGGAPPTVNTATANQVRVTVPTGAAAVTGRKIYRSKANLEALQYLGPLADNTTTVVTDLYSDTILGVAPPGTDTSGLTQPNGQVPAGSSTIILTNAAVFLPGGGWAIVGNGDQVIYYGGTTANSLTGVPALGGNGALVAAISYNSTITTAPALTGVVGLLEAVLTGAPVHVWVQRDDVAAQAAMITLDGGGDGIYEHIVSDERRSEPSLIQMCDAQLQLYSRPIVAVTYASRDLKTKSGKTVVIDLPTPAIQESLTIQDVTITEIGIGPVNPKFTVTASSVHHTFEAVLRMLIRNAEA